MKVTHYKMTYFLIQHAEYGHMPNKMYHTIDFNI